MFLRAWINILMLSAAAYGAWIVMTGSVPYAPIWKYYLYQASPWVLLYGSMRAWHRCLTWRRMMAAKNISPDLARGAHRPSRSKQRPSVLEYACLGLSLMSIAAILKQLGAVR